MAVRSRSDSVSLLANDFREQLNQFYAWSNLAPPYHSIELAVRALVARLDSQTHEERTALINNPDQKWALYQQAFLAGGLNRKHRGILTAMARTHTLSADSAPDYRIFLRVFRRESNEKPLS